MAKSKKPSDRDLTNLENWLIYGIDIVHRRISFGTIAHGSDEEENSTNTFNENNVSISIRAIDKMMDISNQPIEIHMSSYGGDVYDMLALVDKIQETKCQFNFYGRGKIMSAATWVMAVCDSRRLSKNTQVMLHHGSGGFVGSSVDCQIEANYGKKLTKTTTEIFAKNSWIRKTEVWEYLLQRDLYMSASRAVKLGLADEVIDYAKRGNFRKGLRAKTFNRSPDKRQISGIIQQMSKEIMLPSKLVVEVSAPEEEFESVKPYDNSDTELGQTKQDQEPALRQDSEEQGPEQ